MPFMYPEQLRELRAQYPNTQFDGHGRVVGGTPLNQYNAQPANPAAIPASVRTYSQFDPATGTWVRHTNGSAPAQSSAPAQGTPINFQQVLGYTPAGFEGAALNVGGRANVQPVQVMRPLVRGNARDVSATVAPRDLGSGVTGQYQGNYDYSKAHGNENPIAPLTQPGVVYPPARNLEGYDPNNPGIAVATSIPATHDGEIRNINNIPSSSGIVGQPVVNVDSAEIGQAVPIREATPQLDMTGNQWWSEARKPDSLGRNIMTAFAAPVDLGLALTGLGAGYRLIKGANAAYKAGRGVGLVGRGGAATASRVPVGPAPLSGSGAAANALPNAAQPSRLAGLQRLAIDGAGRLYDATADFARMAYDRAAQLGARVRAGNWWTR